MAERRPIRHNKAAEKASSILRELLRDLPTRDFAVELWDGTRWNAEPSKFCRFTWHIHNPRVLQALFRSDRELALAESYIYGDFDISGDLLAVFPVADSLMRNEFSVAEKMRLSALAMGLPSAAKSNRFRAQLRGHLEITGQGGDQLSL